ncbi:MAG: DUF4398 domain-containing protein [Nitrospirae bacterium]|nr:DUF4398 domain-containing protein [Nitrospirota bacterium]
MRRTSVKLLLVALALSVFLIGCAKKPETEINNAKAALDSAIQEGAEKYAKEEAKLLNDDLTAAQDEIKVQDEKFFKNYDKAKEMLASVQAKADSLKAEIPARKEKAKNDAQAALDAAKTAVADANALLAKAPRGKGTMADIEALKADAAALQDSIVEVETLMTSEEYFAAADKANGIKDKAAEVSAQITAALEKKGKK